MVFFVKPERIYTCIANTVHDVSIYVFAERFTTKFRG